MYNYRQEVELKLVKEELRRNKICVNIVKLIVGIIVCNYGY
jgi:hypothetical protein